MFRTVPLSIIRNFSLYTQQWYMSQIYAGSLRTESGWNGSSILILLASCPQDCMTYTIAVCTVKNSWWWTEELSETCRISFQNKFGKLVHLVCFIIGNPMSVALHSCQLSDTKNDGKSAIKQKKEECQQDGPTNVNVWERRCSHYPLIHTEKNYSFSEIIICLYGTNYSK